MAITRSQIARQLLAEGGAPRKGFANGTGFEGSPEMGGSRSDSPSPSSFDDGYGGGDEFARPTYSQQLSRIQDPMDKPGTTGETFPNLSKVTPRNLFTVSGDNPMLHRSLFERLMLQATPFGTAINLGEMNAFNMPAFRYSRTGGTNIRDDDDDTGDNDNIIKPMLPMIPKLPTDIEPEKSDYDEFVQRFTLPERFRLAEGGEPRQAYGLGKLVKKVTGAVKKVAKSDIGKAALAGAAIYGLGGGTFFGRTLPGISTSGGFAFGNIAPNLFGVAGADEFGGSKGILGSLKLTGGFGSKMPSALGAIAGATALTAALTPKQEAEVDSLSSRIADRTGIDVEQIRKEV